MLIQKLKLTNCKQLIANAVEVFAGSADVVSTKDVPFNDRIILLFASDVHKVFDDQILQYAAH